MFQKEKKRAFEDTCILSYKEFIYGFYLLTLRAVDAP